MIDIQFASQKSARKCLHLIGRFARETSFVSPSAELARERVFSKQFRAESGRKFYPTDEAWKAFEDFCLEIHNAEPFLSRSTHNCTFQALVRAMGAILGENSLPDCVGDLIDHLPKRFASDVLSTTRQFGYVTTGIEIEDSVAYRMGRCWLLRRDAMDLANVNHHDYMRNWIEEVIHEQATILLGPPMSGTADSGVRVISARF